MGKALFGKDETVTCLVPVKLKGAEHESLCLADKTTTYFVAAGVYLRDDGYVLKVESSRDTYYPLPAPAELKTFQEQGLLPAPLPPYSVPVSQYLFGYSLWLIIAGMIAFERLKAARTRRRKARDAAVPVSLGPPRLATEGDRFIAEAVAPLLQAGEQVQHQAYGQRDRADGVVAAARNAALFGVLTDRRLLLVKTRLGAFKPVLENHGVEELPRDAIVDASEDDYLITFALQDGSARTLLVSPGEKHFSNQRAFLRDVPRLLGRGQPLEAQPHVLG